MRTLCFLSSWLIAFVGFTQTPCATADYLSAQKAASPQADAIAAAESFLQKNTGTSTPEKEASNNVIRIPVVVHVLYNNASQNLSDEQIKSQITALNRDFRRANADTVNTPERFRSLAADVGVEFYLATADPYGRATTGIVRKHTSVGIWLYNDKMKFSSSDGDNVWDSKSYFNIWVANLVTGAGYSSAPGGDASRDGIVINTSAFGIIGGNGNYSMGRGAVHETGHWLGLRHIWGDAECGDDGISDTPPQSTYTQGCPSGFRSSCGNGATGDMYMNYMDYTADACMNLFTLEQKKKMRACFTEGGPRVSLLQSKGLQKPWVEGSSVLEAAGVDALVYPNPASDAITLAMGIEHLGQTLQILSVNGVRMQSLQITSVSQKLNLASYKAGVYFIKGDGLLLKFVKL